MIDSDKQRRWWFANHPEYSNSHKGKRNTHDNDGGGGQERVSPEAVDAYVDEALKYLDGPEAELLKFLKRNFGTEGESNRSDQRLAFLREPAYRSHDEVSASQKTDEREPTFGDALVKGIDNTLQDWQRWLGLSARLPPKGTPERREIDAARVRGRNAKIAEERADIKAGGKGSGVWTQEELQGIRQTGKFPDDVRWHHDPTVANRPDLAGDPRSVHPLRGGNKGHLWKGHQGNYQNPRKGDSKKD